VSTTARIVASIGGGLQVVGVALVFWEIWGVQRLLNKRTWTRAMGDALATPFRWLGGWLRARERPRARVVQLDGSSLGMSGSLSARLTVTEAVGATLEQRIEVHRRRLDSIDRQLDEIRAEATKLQTSLGDRLNAAVTETTEQTKQLREVVDTLGAGSLGLRAVGGILVLIGSALWVASEWL